MSEGEPGPIAATRHFGVPDAAASITMNVMMGLNVVAMKIVITALGPLTTSAVRYAIVFLLCSPWALRDIHRWRMLAAFGFFNGTMMAAFMSLALNLSSNVGALAIVAQLSIPFSVILGVLLLGEKVSAIRITGTVLAFFGVVIMLFDPRIAQDLVGVGLMTVAALSWSICSLLQRRLSGVPVLTFYAWTGLMTALFITPAALVFEPSIVARTLAMDWSTAAWMAFSIVGVTIIGNGCVTWMFRHHPVSVVMPLTLGTPVVAVVAARLLLDAPITLSMVLGGGMVIGGIAVIMAFEAKRDGKAVAAVDAG